MFIQSFMAFDDCFINEVHKFLVKSFIVLKIFEKIKVFGKEVMVERHMIEICLEQFFRILEILKIFHNEIRVLN